MASLAVASLPGLGPLRGSSRQSLRSRARSWRAGRPQLCRRGLLPRAISSLEPPAAAAPAKLAPPRPLPTHRSGQPASWAHGEALVGSPLPLGATIDPNTGGTNFALFSGSSYAVSLCLFTEADLGAGRVSLEIPLDPLLNRTGDTWHVMLPDLDSSLLYGFRVCGPHQEKEGKAEGHRFNQERVIVDPYAKAIISRRVWGEMGPELAYGTPGVLGTAATWPQMAATLPRPRAPFDWEGDRPLNRPMEDLVVYEMHVRGFTRHPSSGVSAPGTYRGMVERLDYLASLGVNAVELMPIHEFNELEYYQVIPGTGVYRYNMWGYSTVGFMAPMSRFSAAAAEGGSGEDVLDEFRTLVKECHKRGIEVILDVVFNHTAEGNEQGPTLSFRGLDNRVFYMLAPAGQYYNYSGCGNTVNCNHPVVRQFILDSLKYWVEEMHVDGFRFDLGSILTRAHSQWHKTQPVAPGEAPVGAPADGATSVAPHSDGAIVDGSGMMTDGAGVPTGTPLTDPPLIEMISEDPVLRHTKLIAEAWDCDGLNQVGAFPHYGRWSEWNGHFRDSVRQFIKGTDGPWVSNFASALCGSPNIYLHEPGEQDWWGNNGGRRWKGGRGPTASVNFVVAHDGFTLADLVSYNEKKNLANGEDNRDGESHNLSWNCGAEGPTDKPSVLGLRQRQMRNMMAALLLAHGVPMFYMGDEYGHSKGGNNNTYCHDSEVNWLDWDQALRDEHGLLRFTRHMIGLRQSTPELRRSAYVGGEMEWHGTAAHKPDWTDASRFLAFTLRLADGGGLYVAFNTSHLPQVVQLPQWGGRLWQPLADSGKVSPYDFLRADERLSEAQVTAARAASAMWTVEHAYPILPWSMVVLESVPEHDATSPLTLGAANFFNHVTEAQPPAVEQVPPVSPPGWWEAAAASVPPSPPTPSYSAQQHQAPEEVLSAARSLAARVAAQEAAGHVPSPLDHPPLADGADPSLLHASSALPTDVDGAAAHAYHGPPQDLLSQMTAEEARAYQEMLAENDRLRALLGGN